MINNQQDSCIKWFTFGMKIRTFVMDVQLVYFYAKRLSWISWVELKETHMYTLQAMSHVDSLYLLRPSISPEYFMNIHLVTSY